MTMRKNSLTVCAAVAAGLALAAIAAPASAADFTAQDLTDDLTVVSGPDGNVLVGADAAGLTLVDGGSAENADALLDFIRAETGQDNIAQLVVTHWHPDRIGLNETAGEQGAQIAAHDFTLQYLKHGTDNEIVGDLAPLPAAAVPNVQYYDEGGVLPFGEDEIRVGYLPQAHTDGDVYAYFPGANVLAAGGAVINDGWNMMDWRSAGYLGGALDSYEILLEVADDDTVIVPGSGPLMTKADLQAQFDMYSEIYDRLATSLKSSFSPEEAIAADPTGDYHPEWADADRFADLAYHSFYAHLRGNPRLGAIP